MRVYIICLLTFLGGIALWLSGWDMAVTHYFERIDTPLTNTLWRLVGEIGLGRWQLLFCLFAAWGCVRLWPEKRWGLRNKAPYGKLDTFIVLRLFAGALFIWARLLTFDTKHVVGTGTFMHRSARYCQQLPWRARVWFYSIPIMFGAGAVCTVLKVLIGRPRPKMMLWHDTVMAIGPTLSAKFHSFPSGHTTTTFALLAVLSTAFPRYRWAFWPVACLTGLARVGAVTPHFLGDVVAGAAIGYGVGYYLVQQYRLTPRR